MKLNPIKIHSQDQDIEVTPRISKRAKRIFLKIGHNNNVELVMPSKIYYKKAIAFLDSRKEWIAANYSTRPEEISVDNGVDIPILGENYRIRYADKIRGKDYIDNSSKEIIIHGDKQNIKKRVKKLLVELLNGIISDIAKEYCQIIDVKYNKIILRDTKSRWGSCSTSGTLSFSFRVIMVDIETIKYLVAHEVSHIIHMNHSHEFWSLVAKLHPNYKTHKNLLKKSSSEVHKYTF